MPQNATTSKDATGQNITERELECGINTRVRAQCSSLPSVFLANVETLETKLDDMRGTAVTATSFLLSRS